MDESDPILLHDRQPRRRQRYRLRLLACLATSLLLSVGAVRLCPAPAAEEDSRAIPEQVYHDVNRREVQQTKQAERTSPPPPPPPVPLYETDRQIEQEPLELDVDLAFDPSSTEAPPGPPHPRDGEAETSQSAAPAMGARQLRIPEPRYTEAARAEDVRARVELEVTISAGGRVEDARILRRVLLSTADQSGDAGGRTVQTLGYGLEEAALDAAERTLFRPARTGGEAVKSHKTLTLTFGPGG
jgi:protein TonB